MDKLINLVSQKAGISPDQARTAVETVLGFLKDRLPGPLANQVDSAVQDGGQDKDSKLGGSIPGL